MFVRSVLAVTLLVPLYACDNSSTRIQSSRAMTNLQTTSFRIRNTVGRAKGNEGFGGHYTLTPVDKLQMKCEPIELTEKYVEAVSLGDSIPMSCTQTAGHLTCSIGEDDERGTLEGFVHDTGAFGLQGSMPLPVNEAKKAGVAVALEGNLQDSPNGNLFRAGFYTEEGDKTKFCVLVVKVDIDPVTEAEDGPDASNDSDPVDDDGAEG